MIRCKLICQTDSIHLQQLYTGFAILHRTGVVRVNQTVRRENIYDKNKPIFLRDARMTHLKVVLDNRRVLYYDEHDSFEIDPEVLREVDFYFKRSYADAEVTQLCENFKVFPLGLNYLVYCDGFDRFSLERASLQEGLEVYRSVLRGLGVDYILGNRRYGIPRLARMEAYPDLTAEPRVLFIAQAWNPEDAHTKEKSDEREYINNMRADCVRLLRKEFKEYFLGGLIHDNYAQNKFADCLLSEPRLAKKRNYIRLVKQFPIGVATTGLHGSIGWKLAEYVSLSKAIVTERLNFRVPGQFAEETNYLEFSSPAGCVEAVTRLFQDHELRCRMMMNNFRYYHSYLRPDSLVLNTLMIATPL
jgi:hypothetical protein